MSKKEKLALPAIGGSSLLVIFAVLCMTVLSLLSLTTVLAEKRLSDAAAEGVTDYYAAELQAQTVFARLRSGEPVENVDIQGAEYRYSCAISQNQQLEVTLKKEENSWRILRWQAVAFPEEIQQTLPVWQGS